MLNYRLPLSKQDMTVRHTIKRFLTPVLSGSSIKGLRPIGTLSANAPLAYIYFFSLILVPLSDNVKLFLSGSFCLSSCHSLLPVLLLAFLPLFPVWLPCLSSCHSLLPVLLLVFLPLSSSDSPACPPVTLFCQFFLLLFLPSPCCSRIFCIMSFLFRHIPYFSLPVPKKTSD